MITAEADIIPIQAIRNLLCTRRILLQIYKALKKTSPPQIFSEKLDAETGRVLTPAGFVTSFMLYM
jgi:hypothetical protein